MIPDLLPGNQTTSLISLVFKPESLIAPVFTSSNWSLEDVACLSNEYWETEKSAVSPASFGVATPRLGALINCLDFSQLTFLGQFFAVDYERLILTPE